MCVVECGFSCIRKLLFDTLRTLMSRSCIGGGGNCVYVLIFDFSVLLITHSCQVCAKIFSYSYCQSLQIYANLSVNYICTHSLFHGSVFVLTSTFPVDCGKAKTLSTCEQHV